VGGYWFPEVITNLKCGYSTQQYEYADFLNEENETINFDSYMKDESSLEEGELRMLDVDNPLVLPIDTHIRFIVTAADVLHDWAMPALALKVDACPGRLNQASVIIERPGFFYGQCSEICLRLNRSICYGKEKLSLIFPSTKLSINYDVGLCELSLKYIQIRVLNLLKLGAYVGFINIINKIIAKLILFERSLTRNWDFSGYIPKKSDLDYNANISVKSICMTKRIREKDHPGRNPGGIKAFGPDLKTKNVFKQEDILISERKKVFWLTEIKSAIIQSTNGSKLGNPVFHSFIEIMALKHNSDLQLNSESWIEESVYEAFRGQDWYQDNLFSLGALCAPRPRFTPALSFNSLCSLKGNPEAGWTTNNSNTNINYPNYHAYNVWNSLNWRLQDTSLFKFRTKIQFGFRVVFRKYSSDNLPNNIKPLKNKKLTKDISHTLKKGMWITTEQKQKLTAYIEKVQKSISETTLKYGMYSKKLNYLTENYLHSLLVQVFAVEVLSKNKGSKTAGIDNLILDRSYESKILILSKLKRFYSIDKIQGRSRIKNRIRRVYNPKFNPKELRPASSSLSSSLRRKLVRASMRPWPMIIPSIIDRAIQQLFLIIIDPIIEVNSDLYSFGYRKGRNQIMAIGHIQKKLQTKSSRGEIRQIHYPIIWDANIRKCFDSISHKWLLQNIPVPKKYKRIFKKWLTGGYIEFGSEKIYQNYEGVARVVSNGILSPLLMNMTLNGIEKLIEDAKLEYKSKIKRSTIRISKYEKKKLAIKMKSIVNNKFKEVEISCNFIRYADDFIIICGSPILLDIIKNKVNEFLNLRGLEIHPNKSRTIYFKINVPFNFLGYTFVYLIRTNHIRNKFLMRNTREYRLGGRPHLFVYPSTMEYKSIKLKIKEILRSNYNTTIFQLISIINPIIRKWVNYYSFSNSGGTLTSLRKFMFDRLKIYLIKKHKRASIRWLMRQYFLINLLPEQYNLEPEILLKVKPGILKNKWNFYGLAFKDCNGNLYDKPKINILLWPNKIKKLVTATIFTPSRELLGTNWYLNKELWNKEMIKLQKYHFSYNPSLWETLYKRDGNICYLCKDELINDDNNINNDVHIHHINPCINDKSYAVDNLALVHPDCHIGWHLEPVGQMKKRNKSKNNETLIY